jgi:hypothetical protein
VTSLLGAVAFVLVGVWGVVNLSEGDWFIGGVMVACAIVGLWSLVVRLFQQGRRRPPGPLPPANKPAR